ncbi:MAG: hypothetical protein Q8J75_03510, partial [Rhodocyclaceae bacterium]|nr:hypothetical protein [Rhodocyclaceae bacterium]
VALGALVPLFVQTHLPPVPLLVMVACATLFFIFVPGRMVPAMAIMTSAVEPRLRGTFLSLNGTAQNLGCGIATYLGGLMMTQDAAGKVVGYGNVGFLAMGATLLTIYLVGRIHMHAAVPINAAVPADAVPINTAGRTDAVPPAPTS